MNDKKKENTIINWTKCLILFLTIASRRVYILRGFYFFKFNIADKNENGFNQIL